MSKLITSSRVLSNNETKLNRSHPDQTINVSVRFKYDDNHRANRTDIDEFVSFIRQSNLSVPTLVSYETGTVNITSTVSLLEKLFDVELNECAHAEGGTFRHFDGSIELPNHFDDKIIAVFGLNTGFRAQSYIRPNLTGTQNSYYPEQVAKLYNFPAGDGTGQTVAIGELGGGYVQDDLNTYAMSRNLPLPNVTAVSIDGAVNVPGKAPSGADGEVMLDIEIIASIAPKANIIVYFAPNTAKGFDDLLTFIVSDTTHNPKIISISWGGPETSYAQQDINSMNQTLAKATSLGINVFVASGDNGSSDGTKTTAVDFPASSPNIIACGGTEITTNNGVIASEVVWNDGAQGGSGGGGYSAAFPVPAYQANIVKSEMHARPRPRPHPHKSGRGVPDVAGNASPNSGYNVLVDGQTAIIGGTSAVSPLYAALCALLNQNLGKNVGWLNPLIYQNETAFNDITSGNNGAYSAATGWDACTGLGSPNGGKLLTALKG